MNEIVEPVVIISDVHLSAVHDWRRQVESLRGLWQGARTVVFNGDTLNYSLSANPDKCSDALGAIKELCRRDAVTPIILSGNSDFRMGGPHHVFLSRSRVLVLHGEVIFPGMSPWRDDSKQIASALEAVMLEMPPARRRTLDGILSGAREALRRSYSPCIPDRRNESKLWKRMLWWTHWFRKPLRVLTILNAWRRMPTLGAEFCKRYGGRAQIIIFGHAHRRGVWRVDGRTVINTGSFEGPGRPSMVTVSEGQITVQLVDRRGDTCLPGKTLAEITLDPCED